MFDFEKLEVYQVTKTQNINVLKWLLSHNTLDTQVSESWKKASLGTVLNLAEASGRMQMEDKKQYITMARSCINECVVLLEICKELNLIEDTVNADFYNKYEQMSKMMLGMIRSYN
jgi:four helix bundle protein